MTIKKKYDNHTSFPIKSNSFDNEAFIQKRGNNWYFHMWINTEQKYLRKSLKTSNPTIAIAKGEQELFEIRNKLKKGKTITSLNCKQGVQQYLEYRKGDVGKSIVIGRYKTIETHLTHFLNYIDEQTKLKDLSFADCIDYFEWRNASSNKEITPTTLKNEQSTINSLMKFLKKRDEVEIDAFEFRHMKDIQTDTNTIKRQTFTDEEYRLLYKYLYKNYIAKSLKLDERQLAFRQLIRHWILISANSGMRSGEQRQLKWSDVELEDVKDEKGKTITLAKITIRKETTKVKKARVFHCRCGEQFKRLRELQTHRVNDGLVFSTNGVSELDKSVLNKEWKKIMEEVGIQNYRERKIVPYSLRHYCITKRIESGKTLMNVAQMCGTSVAQIERTYYHLQSEVSRQTALG